MNKKTIIFLISIVLMVFVMIKVLIVQLCVPMQNNVVVNAVTSTISSSGGPSPHQERDPMSWGPIINHLLAFFPKACNR